MTSIPLHRARAALSWIVERSATCPVTITRNGKPVAVVVSPAMVEQGEPINSDLRAALRADLLHALAILSPSQAPGNRPEER
ncbi:type II toxin-antitoxin system Phd/YefM family antitoxin [Tsukamurella pseudospumae]|uniref:Antitoxin n=1 Tax=Tsukamurella pseudospumae TaxID=239498 RepID=A0A138A8I0_9ACTN|nr:type II toxin-antitoxin system Phd/YefM family antitoxin [Tsukamurella pseudospumae]KXP06742.1 hypothetical protein AXK60_11805 [Tsukamurella pseudospumae]